MYHTSNAWAIRGEICSKLDCGREAGRGDRLGGNGVKTGFAKKKG